MGIAAQQARLLILSMRTKLEENAKQIAGKLNGKDDLFENNNSKDIGGDSFTSSSKQGNNISVNDLQAELLKQQKDLKNFFNK